MCKPSTPDFPSFVDPGVGISAEQVNARNGLTSRFSVVERRKSIIMNNNTLKGGRLQQEAEYYEAHYEELLEKHPEQWVAILAQKVVGISSDPRELLQNLKDQGVSLRRVLVQHVTRNRETLILAA